MKSRLILLVLTALFFYSCSDESGIDSIQDPVLEVIQNVSDASLTNHVKILSGELPFNHNGTETYIQTRNWAHDGNDIAADYIESKLNEYGLEVTNQPFDHLGRNVIGIHRGTVYPNNYFIICAHYDNCGVRNCDPDSSSVAPGSDDNASGTAAVLEAARILSQYPTQYSIVFALWDEEEIGLIGSQFYAADARANNMSINGVINLDMIAWNGDADHIAKVIVWDTENIPELGMKATEINDEYNIGLTLEYIYRDRGSDFVSFWINEYPAISIIEDFDDWNANYHTINDTYPNMDMNYFLKMAKLSLGMLADYAFN